MTQYLYHKKPQRKTTERSLKMCKFSFIHDFSNVVRFHLLLVLISKFVSQKLNKCLNKYPNNLQYSNQILPFFLIWCSPGGDTFQWSGECVCVSRAAKSQGKNHRSHRDLSLDEVAHSLFLCGVTASGVVIAVDCGEGRCCWFIICTLALLFSYCASVIPYIV